MATRHERVVLELDDRFSTGMARAAAATALLDRNLNDLDGDHINVNRNLSATSVETDRMGAAMRRNGAEIDKFSGRLRLFADAAAILGPGIVPIGAVAVPAVTALASQLGFATIGAGSMVVAFQGVGDALKAVNEAALEPTAANLEKAHEAMSKLGPEAREFVTRFQEIRPVLQDIRDSAAAGWFPGLTESLDSLVEVGPKVGEILRVIGETGGNLLAEGAEALAGPEWGEFLSFVQDNAPQALEDLGRSVGNVARGLVELWMAFDPLNDDVNGWLLDSSRAFAEWADGLAETQGFQDFVAYLRESGPQVADALGSIGNALLQIVEAAAPLGGPVLAAVTAVADALALIADSEAGTAILAAASAMALLSRASAGFAVVSKTTWATNISGARGLNVQAATLTKTLGAATVGMAAFAAAQSGVAEKAGLSNTALGAMAGTFAGPYGAAIGTGIGFTLDLKAANDELTDSIERMNEATNANTLAEMNAALFAHLESRKSFSAQASSFLSSLSPSGIKDIITGDSEALVEMALGGEKATEAMYDLFEASDRVTFENLGSGIAGIAAQMEHATDEIQNFSDSFRGLSDLLDDRASLREYEAAVDQLNASIEENGQAWEESGAKGRANLEALDALVGTAIARSDQLFEHGRKAAAQGMLTRALEDLREFRRENPRAAASLEPLFKKLRDIHAQRVKPKMDLDTGAFKLAANAVASRLDVLDGLHAKPKVTLGGAGTALGQLGAIVGQLNRVDGMVANATVNVSRSGIPFRESAFGNFFSAYAKGGMDRANSHWPEFAGPGPTRVWREPETGGESYIPHANDGRRPRAESILAQTADLFGMRVSKYAFGGIESTYARGGFGGSNPLQGIGNAATLNAGPFAAAMHNLTQIGFREYDSRALQLDRTDEQFERILRKREEHAKKEADADKSRLKSMLETQKAFEEQVAGLFKSDVFAKGEETVYAVFPDGSRVLLEGGLDSVTASQSQYFQQSGATFETDSGFDPLANLQGDVANIQEAMRLYQQLRRRGFDGPAFRDLAASADVERLREMVALSNADLQQIETTFNRRDQLLGQLGNQVGGDFNSEIRALRSQYEASREEFKAAHRDLMHAIKDPGGVTPEIVKLQHVTAQASRGVGRDLAQALNNSASDGMTGRGQR